MNAYRDDLEAAQLRAQDLEHELATLRERNEKLEEELAGGDTAEQLANARRLAAAIQREEAERRQRQQAELDEHTAAAPTNPELFWHSEQTRLGVLCISSAAGVFGALMIIAAVMASSSRFAAVAFLVNAGLVVLIATLLRAAFGRTDRS
jgi:VIT1/CCC1 family predicted Fe2+/Mn2+ transporter